MEWCTIESDPGVFTQLIDGLGVETPVEVSEVVSMDDLSTASGCKGLILLFRYDKGTMAPTDSEAVVGTADPSVFFCKQVRPAAAPRRGTRPERAPEPGGRACFVGCWRLCTRI